MKFLLGSNRGSSTILITLLMVTLVVFGLLSISTSASELKLARKNGVTNRAYYTLDSEGVRFLYNIKSLMKQALDELLNDYDKDLFFSHFERLLNQSYEGLNYVIDKNSPPIITIKRTIILEDSTIRRYLDITLEITNPLESDINSACKIKEWRLWQESFHYDNKIELWDGTIDEK